MRSWLHISGLVLSLCFPLSQSAHATPIAAGTDTSSGVAAGGAALHGSIMPGGDGLATAASLSHANAAYNIPTFSTINSRGVSGNSPAANFASIGVSLCKAGTACAQVSYLQIYSPNLNSGLVGGSLAADAASVGVMPEPSGSALMLTGLLMIGAVVLVRRSAPGGVAAA